MKFFAVRHATAVPTSICIDICTLIVPHWACLAVTHVTAFPISPARFLRNICPAVLHVLHAIAVSTSLPTSVFASDYPAMKLSRCPARDRCSNVPIFRYFLAYNNYPALNFNRCTSRKHCSKIYLASISAQVPCIGDSSLYRIRLLFRHSGIGFRTSIIPH